MLKIANSEMALESRVGWLGHLDRDLSPSGVSYKPPLFIERFLRDCSTDELVDIFNWASRYGIETLGGYIRQVAWFILRMRGVGDIHDNRYKQLREHLLFPEGARNLAWQRQYFDECHDTDERQR